jgi:hypothetical protein
LPILAVFLVLGGIAAGTSILDQSIHLRQVNSVIEYQRKVIAAQDALIAKQKEVIARFELIERLRGAK